MAKSSCCASIRICNQISSIHIGSQPWFCTTVTLGLGGRVHDRKILGGCWPASQANEYGGRGGRQHLCEGQGLSVQRKTVSKESGRQQWRKASILL